MGDGTGIAGAQDYVPRSSGGDTRSSGEDTWTCATCGKEVSWGIASAKAWVDKGLQQECKECYNESIETNI